MRRESARRPRGRLRGLWVTVLLPALSVCASVCRPPAAFASISGGAPPGPCTAGATTLCIDDRPGDSRFEIRVHYETAQGGGLSGYGHAIPLASLGVSRGGLFWFFSPENPEMLIKVVNACGLDQKFWVFSSAGTNVGLTTTVRDTRTGAVRTYTNDDLTAAAPVQDTSAFGCSPTSSSSSPPVAEVLDARADFARWAAATMRPESRPPLLAAETFPSGPSPTVAAACVSDPTTLCISDQPDDRRFQIRVHYKTSQGGLSGEGHAIPLAGLGVTRGGLFWFFSPDNPEMLIKVIDACELDRKFWVFYSAGTNVGFAVTVSDMQTGRSVVYQNPDLTAAAPLLDTAALSCGSAAAAGRMAFVGQEESVNHIYLMDVDASGTGTGANPTRLTSDASPENYPSWSSDGRRIAYQRDLDGSAICVVNADGSGQRRLSPTPGFDVTPSWSPDGTQIVYSRLHQAPRPNDPPLTDIRVMNADGTGDHAILANTVFSVEPRWSVRGQFVFMSLMNGSELNIYVMNADGTGLRQLTNLATNGDPVWSPDGARITFGSDREGGNKVNVFVMNADGTGQEPLTHFDVPYEAGDTNWSSDGKKIAFEYDIDGMKQSDPNAYAEVWTMNPDGSGAATTGVRCSGVGCAPRWQPR